MRAVTLRGASRRGTRTAVCSPLLVRFGSVAFVLVMASSTAALGQISGEQATTLADAERSNLPPDTLGGELSFGKLGEDLFVTLALRLTFEREDWGVGLQLPLRFRIDRGEDDTGDYGGLRKEDWDQVSDFLRVLRFVYVGQRDKRGPYYVRGGELSQLGIGYGTIMYRYHNGLDAARFHAGLHAAVNIDAYGGEVMIGDVLAPYLAGLRFTAKPFQVAWGEGWWEMFVAGATLMTDSRAPFQLETNGGVVVTDEDRVPVVTRERALVIAGLDVGAEVLRTPILAITPYTALNKMSVVDNGWGWHAGVLWQFALPLLIDTLSIDLRTEYQRVSGDYRGPYFNTAYEIERYQVLASDGGTVTPKLRALCGPALDCELGTPGAKNGVFFDLRAGLPNWIFVGGEYLNYDGGGADGSLRLFVEVPALEFVQLSAFYYRVNITGTDDLFAIDDRSAIVAQAAIPIAWVFTAQLRWWRIWQAGEEGYESVDDWSIGLGASIAL